MKLNIGAGPQSSGKWIDGYFNIDRSNTDTRLREATPLSWFQDETVEEVRASHVLEHFSHRETEAVLREWIRVLRPGGWLKVAVPDFKYIATEYLRGVVEEPLAMYCMGGQVDENDYHKAIFDEDGLRDCFTRLGLVNVTRWTSEIQDCASLPVSLNLMGQKPYLAIIPRWTCGWPEHEHYTADEAAACYGAQAEGGANDPFILGEVTPAEMVAVAKLARDIPKNEIVALMSTPRLSFTDNAFCVLQGVASLGLRVIKSSGVFWGQCLTELMETAIRDGARYVLTIDYDTLFTADDVRRLYTLLEEYPNADAVMPLQMKRDGDTPLFTRNRAVFQEEIEIARQDFDVDLYPAVTGHFGLTLLRCASFAKLSRPWFRSEPNEDGRWGDGHKDEDIAFWHNWNEAGNTLFLVPKVTIGHLQLLATWPDTDLRARHQYLSEFQQSGKPSWAWK